RARRRAERPSSRVAVPGERLRETLVQGDGRLPAELVPDPRSVERTGAQLALAQRLGLPLDRDAGRALERVEQLEHRGPGSGADVVRPGPAGLAGEEERAGDVADVDVVARLGAVAGPRRRPPRGGGRRRKS